ncbi:MAG: hypothetical protein PHR28_07065, partial [candidate division Zixibacteria bacterium]|nr:hypothetical protein [candidate division Zixibacteria bacterium]
CMSPESQRDTIAKNKVLYEYCKYLYEMEDSRGDKLNGLVRTYMSFIAFALGGGATIIQFVIDRENYVQISRSQSASVALFMLTSISACLILCSGVLTIFAAKIRRFEGLNSACKVTIQAVLLKGEGQLIPILTADYAVAADRNYANNQRKAKYLSLAVAVYLAGILVAVIDYALFQMLLVGGSK